MATHERSNPYASYKFQVHWDGRVVAGVNKVGALTRTTQVVPLRTPADPAAVGRAPGPAAYDPITLERGLTVDAEFVRWANKVWDHPNSPQLGEQESLADFRRDITINLINEAGQFVMAWNVDRCWVSAFTALPELDGDANAVAIGSMTLQHEGWSRDFSVTTPDEPTFTDPDS